MNSEKETIIGAATVIRGNLQGDENLVVQGRVEGTISLSKTLIVESGGVVQADVDVRNAVINGVLVGNVTAAEYVQINDQGRMVGDISAPRVIIVDGAAFKGNVDMGDLEAPRPREPEALERPPASVPRRAPAVRPAPSPRRSQPEPERRQTSRQASKSTPEPPPKPKVPRTSSKSKPSPPKPPSVAKGKKKVRRKK